MPRRVTLTDRQREALFHLPVDQGDLLRHYTLSDEDLGHIRQRRRAHNRFGFALQLCVLRYPGRVLTPGELIPAQVSDFIAAQLGLSRDDLLLYAFTPNATPSNVRALVGGKINEPLIERNWPDILRVTATIAAGIVAPSQILRKLASYPRQNELALALREIGRIERTLFMIDWILDAGLQRQAQIGLNKGEAHHALKPAISFHRRGEIRDRSGEGQHYRIAGMNLLAAIIIFWNTMKLGEVVDRRAVDGIIIPPDLLAHVSPLGWEHINLTGEYRWPKSLA